VVSSAARRSRAILPCIKYHIDAGKGRLRAIGLVASEYSDIILYKSSVIPPPPGLAYVCKWLDTDRVAHQCLPALKSCGLHSDRTRLRVGCENRQKRGIYRTGADCLDHGGDGDKEDERIAEDGQAPNERTPEAFVTALRGEVRPDPG
jgi:hypothetical protein